MCHFVPENHRVWFDSDQPSGCAWRRLHLDSRYAARGARLDTRTFGSARPKICPAADTERPSVLPEPCLRSNELPQGGYRCADGLCAMVGEAVPKQPGRFLPTLAYSSRCETSHHRVAHGNQPRCFRPLKKLVALAFCPFCERGCGLFAAQPHDSVKRKKNG